MMRTVRGQRSDGFEAEGVGLRLSCMFCGRDCVLKSQSGLKTCRAHGDGFQSSQMKTNRTERWLAGSTYIRRSVDALASIGVLRASIAVEVLRIGL